MIALIFDVETTGLIDNHTLPLDRQPEIIEFFGCLADLDSGEVLEELDQLIKPKAKTLDPKIKRITHLNEDMLADKPSFKDVAPRIKDLIGKSEAVIAHNLSFDMEMVDLEFERLGEKVQWPATRICTVEQSLHLQGKRLTLSSMYELLFGKAFPDAHRAKSDVQALMQCVIELIRLGEL